MAIGGLLGRSRATSRGLIGGAIGSGGAPQPVDWGKLAPVGLVICVYVFFAEIVDFVKAIGLLLGAALQSIVGQVYSFGVVVHEGLKKVPGIMVSIHGWLVSMYLLVQSAVESPLFPGAVIIIGGILATICLCGWVAGGCTWVKRALCFPCFVVRVIVKCVVGCIDAVFARLKQSAQCLGTTVAFLFFQPIQGILDEIIARYKRVELKRGREEAKFRGMYVELKDTPLDPDIEAPEDEMTYWELVRSPSGRRIEDEVQGSASCWERLLGAQRSASTKRSQNTERVGKLQHQEQNPQQRAPARTSVMSPGIAPMGTGVRERQRGPPPESQTARLRATDSQLPPSSSRQQSARPQIGPATSALATGRRVTPGEIKRAAELEAKLALRERRRIIYYEKLEEKLATEREQEQQMLRRKRQLAYYRTPHKTQSKGKEAMYKRAESLYSEERLLWSPERAAIYGKIEVGSSLSATCCAAWMQSTNATSWGDEGGTGTGPPTQAAPPSELASEDDFAV